MLETLEPMASTTDQQQLAEQLLAQAKEQGVELVGPNGLLNQLDQEPAGNGAEGRDDRALGRIRRFSDTPGWSHPHGKTGAELVPPCYW